MNDREKEASVSPENGEDGSLEPGGGEGQTVLAGGPLPAGAKVAEKDAIVAAMKEVYDPEIPVNIYDLGLIYDTVIDDETGDVDVIMTLTTPMCPVAGILPQQVADAVAAVVGVGVVAVSLTFSPPWTMALMSEDAKLALNLV